MCLSLGLSAQDKKTDKAIEAAEEVIEEVVAEKKEKIVVESTSGTISRGESPGLYVPIKAATVKDVEKHWKKYIKSEYKGKTETERSGEMITSEASIAGLGDDVTIYAKIIELTEGGAGISAYFDNGEGFITTEDETAYKVVENLLYDFGVEERKYAVNEQLDDAKKDHKKLEKDLDGLKSKNKNLHGDIEMYKKKIKQAEEDIVENEKDQESKVLEIDAQETVVSKILDLFNSIE